MAAVSPALRYPDGSRQRVWWPVPSPATVWLSIIGLSDVSRRRFLAGPVLMLSSTALDDVGSFDDRYFLYAEEADWQRSALQRGWRLAVVDAVTAEHAGAATSGDLRIVRAHSVTSNLLYMQKWYGGRLAQVARVGAVIAAARRCVLSRDRRARRLHLLDLSLLVRGGR